MMRLKAIILGLSVVAAFAAGFAVSKWRADAQRVEEIAKREAVFQEFVAETNARIAEDNARTQARESELAGALEGERQQTEGLRREIEERPVIRQVVRTAVAGECAAVPAVDWGLFAELYNRAAAGAPAARAPDAGDAAVSRVAVVAF